MCLFLVRQHAFFVPELFASPCLTTYLVPFHENELDFSNPWGKGRNSRVASSTSTPYLSQPVQKQPWFKQPTTGFSKSLPCTVVSGRLHLESHEVLYVYCLVGFYLLTFHWRSPADGLIRRNVFEEGKWCLDGGDTEFRM